MTGITLQQIGYDILQFYRVNLKNTDEIDIRQIYFWIHNTRAKLLKQKFDRPFALINEAYVQELPALVLDTIDASKVSNFNSSKYIRQTRLNLPTTIERSNFSHTFTRISSANSINESYPIIRYEDISTYGNGKFNADVVAAFIVGGRICLMSKNEQRVAGIATIYARGVFQDPMQAGQLLDSNYNEYSDYPITHQMVEEMKNILLGDTNFKLTGSNIPKETDPVNTNELNSKE